MSKYKTTAALLTLLAATPSAASEPATAGAHKAHASSFMRVYGPSSPPIGYVRFCERNPAECPNAPSTREEPRFELTPQRLAELDRLNRQVNKEIKPATDLELYGVDEYWTYPDTRKMGDCEDYVLVKRKMLSERGWPMASLLITVVRDERRDGHAILTVRTAQGDFVLDNKSDEIKPWHRTTYDFVMRQSYINPSVWMSLEPIETVASVAVSGVRSRR
jgi:predicted transglutaminase-like cysteine proteinase